MYNNKWKIGLVGALFVLLSPVLAGCVTSPSGTENNLELRQEKAQTVEQSTNVSPDSPTAGGYLLHVFAFHDFNGNGNRDPGETPVKGIRIGTADLSGVTGPDGRCEFGYLPEGEYNLAVQDPSGRFRYILPSVSEIKPIGDGLEIVVDKDAETLVPRTGQC